MEQETLHLQNSGFQVCVDRAEGGQLEGTVHARRLTAPLSFQDTGGLLLLLERVMDAQGYPQSYQRSHTFARSSGPQRREEPTLPSGGMSQAQVDAAQGALDTAHLQIITRRASTWQGELTWSDGVVRPFSSDLELLALLDGRFSGN